jgi:TPR repeat protein
MEKVKLGIIGYGNMGTKHAANLMGGKVPNMELAAVCDTDIERRNAFSNVYPEIPVFETAEDVYELGKACFEKEEYEEAYRYYLEAANMGSAEAQCSLGYLYANGLGTERNYEKAFEYYSKAAEQGSAEALYYIGCLYEGGLGVEKNIDKALEYYERASKNGYPDAKRRYQEASEAESQAAS